MRIRGRFRRLDRRAYYDITDRNTFSENMESVTFARNDGEEEIASVSRERVNRSVRSVKRLTDDQARADARA